MTRPTNEEAETMYVRELAMFRLEREEREQRLFWEGIANADAIVRYALDEEHHLQRTGYWKLGKEDRTGKHLPSGYSAPREFEVDAFQYGDRYQRLGEDDQLVTLKELEIWAEGTIRSCILHTDLEEEQEGSMEEIRETAARVADFFAAGMEKRGEEGSLLRKAARNLRNRRNFDKSLN